MELMETFFVEIVTEERLACNVTSVGIGIAESKKKKEKFSTIRRKRFSSLLRLLSKDGDPAAEIWHQYSIVGLI